MATVLANESLQSSWISDDEIFNILREIWIPETCNRPYTANYKNQGVRSLCIGVSARNSTLTSRAYELEAVYRVLNRWLRQHVTEEEFGYRSITINRDHASSLHRDIGNAGPSIIRSGLLFIRLSLNPKHPAVARPRSGSNKVTVVFIVVVHEAVCLYVIVVVVVVDVVVVVVVVVR